jgi:hypothetical protein
VVGSTFSLTASPRLIPDEIDLEPILRYAETNNYLACPAPLLSIMLSSFDLSDLRIVSEEARDEIQEQLKELINAALAFDPSGWVRKIPTQAA